MRQREKNKMKIQEYKSNADYANGIIKCLDKEITIAWTTFNPFIIYDGVKKFFYVLQLENSFFWFNNVKPIRKFYKIGSIKLLCDLLKEDQVTNLPADLSYVVLSEFPNKNIFGNII